MRMGQGVRTGLGHGGITCVLQTQFSSSLWYGQGTVRRAILYGDRSCYLQILEILIPGWN